MSEWQPIETAPENVFVMTKIDDERGARNEQYLKRMGNLWFVPEDATHVRAGMYVYYAPTHWRESK